MRFLCVICSQKERTHIGINGGEHITMCDSKECHDKFTISRGGGVKILSLSAMEMLRETKHRKP